MDWAAAQNNLGIAYRNRILGDQDANLEQAIEHYKNALTIYSPRSSPIDFRRTSRLLGNLYFDTGQWKDAADNYAAAIEAGELLYRSGLSAESKAEEMGENVLLYQNATLANHRLGLATEALLTLERGKTRQLGEALRLKMNQPEVSPKRLGKI